VTSPAAESARPTPSGLKWFWTSSAGRWLLLALLWLTPALVISIQVARNPRGRTVTDLYHDAAQHWWHHQPLYKGVSGMNYLPHFAGLFTPYDWLGDAAGDVAWRLTAMAGLAVGLWLFCGTIQRGERTKTGLAVTLMALPMALPAVANGQANAHFGVVLLFAAWCLRTGRWNRAVLLLWLSAAIKPLGFAAIGLAWAVYPLLWWRLAIGLPLFAAFPFLLGPFDYAQSQYLAVWQNLRECAAVTENRFADINGLFRAAGMPLTGNVSLVVRALAGGLFMAACWLGVRRESEPKRAILWLGAAAAFLMLCNPMNEANSYVIFAPPLALLAVWEWWNGDRRLGWLFGLMGLSMGILPEPLQHVFGNSFSLCWHPAMTLIFAGALVWRFLANREERPEGTVI